MLVSILVSGVLLTNSLLCEAAAAAVPQSTLATDHKEPAAHHEAAPGDKHTTAPPSAKGAKDHAKHEKAAPGAHPTHAAAKTAPHTQREVVEVEKSGAIHHQGSTPARRSAPAPNSEDNYDEEDDMALEELESFVLSRMLDPKACTEYEWEDWNRIRKCKKCIEPDDDDDYFEESDRSRKKPKPPAYPAWKKACTDEQKETQDKKKMLCDIPKCTTTTVFIPLQGGAWRQAHASALMLIVVASARMLL